MVCTVFLMRILFTELRLPRLYLITFHVRPSACVRRPRPLKAASQVMLRFSLNTSSQSRNYAVLRIVVP